MMMSVDQSEKEFSESWPTFFIMRIVLKKVSVITSVQLKETCSGISVKSTNKNKSYAP